MLPVSPSISGTTAAASESGTHDCANSSVLASQSSCELTKEMPSLFGENISIIRSRSRKALNARSSETKVRTSRQSLSDRLTPSLITLGLVRGTTPKSVRQTSGAAIRDFASLPLDGGGAA